MRRAAKVDTTQQAIIDALRRAGVKVWVIGQPVDLLTWHQGKFNVLEVKTPYGKKNPKPKVDKRQVEQNEFIAQTGCPVVTTPLEALLALSVAAS